MIIVYSDTTSKVQIQEKNNSFMNINFGRFNNGIDIIKSPRINKVMNDFKNNEREHLTFSPDKAELIFGNKNMRPMLRLTNTNSTNVAFLHIEIPRYYQLVSVNSSENIIKVSRDNKFVNVIVAYNHPYMLSLTCHFANKGNNQDMLVKGFSILNDKTDINVDKTYVKLYDLHKEFQEMANEAIRTKTVITYGVYITKPAYSIISLIDKDRYACEETILKKYNMRKLEWYNYNKDSFDGIIENLKNDGYRAVTLLRNSQFASDMTDEEKSIYNRLKEEFDTVVNLIYIPETNECLLDDRRERIRI